MIKFTRSFNGHSIRMLRVGQMSCYSGYDVTTALGIEKKRRAVNEVVIAEQGNFAEQVDWEDEKVVFLSEDYIIALSFRVERELMKEFLMWMSEIESVAARFNESPITQGDEDSFSVDTSYFSITQIAKRYGLSAPWLNEFLHQKGIQYKVNDQWVLYSSYQAQNLVRVVKVRKSGEDKNDFTFHTYWTTKGVSFVENILDRSGHVQQGTQLKLF